MIEEKEGPGGAGPSEIPANDIGDGAVADFPDEGAPVSPEDRLAAVEAELADSKDRLLRALAETENVRRRLQRRAPSSRCCSRATSCTTGCCGRPWSALPRAARRSPRPPVRLDRQAQRSGGDRRSSTRAKTRSVRIANSATSTAPWMTKGS